MRTNIFKLPAILLILLVMTSSCFKVKYLPDCESGSCISTNIKGVVYESPLGVGLNNIPVEIKFTKTAIFMGAKALIVSGKTNKNGEFDFNVIIDTTYFLDGWRLGVSITEQKNHIIPSGTYRGFYNYNEDALKDITFAFYKKTALTINLKRTRTDDFETLLVNYLYEGSGEHWIGGVISDATDKTWQVEVGADVYAKIWFTKRLNGEIIEYKIDSLICKQNSNNVITLNY